MSTHFQPAPDAVDPAAVPQMTLASGAKMPTVGLGTFGSDAYGAENIALAVYDAIKSGYRHIDCASVYANEKEIGVQLKRLLDEGLPREALWINSKLWNDKHKPADVIPAFKQSMADLQLDYIDLYFVHWPFPNFHPPHCDVSARSKDARPYIHEDFMATWREMEKLVDMGLVKEIGVSNMTIPKLELLLRDCRIKPAVNEMELHPHFQQPELFEYVKSKGIAPIGYCPVGSPGRPLRDRTPDDTVDIEDPVIVKIAERIGVHPAVVCVKWAVQRGQAPIPFSIHRSKYMSNLRAAIENPLSAEDMRAIASADKNNRLVKGQVFLWREDQDWRDLWDEDGKIAE